MKIYAIAVDNSNGKELYRLARQDGIVKVAPKELLLQGIIEVDNIKIENGCIKPYGKLPRIIGDRVCDNRSTLTILERKLRRYKVCNYIGKCVECNFEDIEDLTFTNASLIEYCDYTGTLANAFKFCNESYREAVDSLLDDGVKIREELDGGKLKKTIQKLNMIGDSSKYTVSDDGCLYVNKENMGNKDDIISKFAIPKGVRIVNSFPKCETLIGCETLEAFNISNTYNPNNKMLTTLKYIDLSMCSLITEYKDISTLIGLYNNIETLYFPKNLLAMVGNKDLILHKLEKAKEIHIGPYIEVFGDSSFYECTAEKFIIDGFDRLKRIEKSAFCRCKKLYINFEKCLNLEFIGRNAFLLTEECEGELNLSKCMNLIEIDNGAFKDVNLTKIYLPNSLKIIGSRVFYYRTEHIEYINIPSHINKESMIRLCNDLVMELAVGATVDIPINVYNKYADTPSLRGLIGRNKYKINIV